VEVCVPVVDEEMKKHLLQCVELWQQDNQQAVRLNAQLENLPKHNTGNAVQAQRAIYELLSPIKQHATEFISASDELRKNYQESPQIY